ncbi:DUF1149 family protein [Enterococcus sp. HY326]|uniref:DUF1149 family protein n=1 Tax=Enterococcus sp. HY326 TaxID=2971265 RepID=UPI00223ED89E|nr:DUF1149 family protein [Enterococcus sp. HY326]
MELVRFKELVEAYHYDARNPKGEYKTELKVGFSPLKTEDEKFPKEDTLVGTRIEFVLPFDRYVISGRVSQVNQVKNRKIETPKDLSQAEVDELAAPLFDLIQRLTYEVTEIALDEPGMKLNFKVDPNSDPKPMAEPDAAAEEKTEE